MRSEYSASYKPEENAKHFTKCNTSKSARLHAPLDKFDSIGWSLSLAGQRWTSTSPVLPPLFQTRTYAGKHEIYVYTQWVLEVVRVEVRALLYISIITEELHHVNCTTEYHQWYSDEKLYGLECHYIENRSMRGWPNKLNEIRWIPYTAPCAIWRAASNNRHRKSCIWFTFSVLFSIFIVLLICVWSLTLYYNVLVMNWRTSVCTCSVHECWKCQISHPANIPHRQWANVHQHWLSAATVSTVSLTILCLHYL